MMGTQAQVAPMCTFFLLTKHWAMIRVEVISIKQNQMRFKTVQDSALLESTLDNSSQLSQAAK